MYLQFPAFNSEVRIALYSSLSLLRQHCRMQTKRYNGKVVTSRQVTFSLSFPPSPEPNLSFFCLRGQIPQTFAGISRIQTEFLVGRFVFTPTQRVASKTYKETNHTGIFFLMVMIYYGINILLGLKLPPRSLLHNDDLYTFFNSSHIINRSLTL